VRWDTVTPPSAGVPWSALPASGCEAPLSPPPIPFPPTHPALQLRLAPTYGCCQQRCMCFSVRCSGCEAHPRPIAPAASAVGCLVQYVLLLVPMSVWPCMRPDAQAYVLCCKQPVVTSLEPNLALMRAACAWLVTTIIVQNSLLSKACALSGMVQLYETLSALDDGADAPMTCTPECTLPTGFKALQAPPWPRLEHKARVHVCANTVFTGTPVVHAPKLRSLLHASE
jgi:hypothetical protein